MSPRGAGKSLRHVGAILVIHALERSRSMLDLAADRSAKFFRGSAQGCAADQWDVIRVRAGPRGRPQRLHRPRHECHSKRIEKNADLARTATSLSWWPIRARGRRWGVSGVGE
jgi:hypothetical protein